MDLQHICTETIQAVREAGEFILDAHHHSDDHGLVEKGTHDFVTEVDKKSEEMLVASLGKIVPAAGFIAEEGTGQSGDQDYNWIIDPIDGTTNFIHGAYPFAVSVGLYENSTPLVGVILELGFNECFYAWKGGGSFLDGTPIRASQRETLRESLIATGFPYTDYNRMDRYMDTIDWFMKNSRGLRRLGSAATDIAWTACGRYDGFYEYGLKAWDVAAGILILEEAGGQTSDFSGGDNHLFGGEIICSNGKTHEEFTRVVQSIMSEK